MVCTCIPSHIDAPKCRPHMSGAKVHPLFFYLPPPPPLPLSRQHGVHVPRVHLRTERGIAPHEEADQHVQ
jgi:hypothetical protein